MAEPKYSGRKRSGLAQVVTGRVQTPLGGPTPPPTAFWYCARQPNSNHFLCQYLTISQVQDELLSGWTLVGPYTDQTACLSDCQDVVSPPPPSSWYCMRQPLSLGGLKECRFLSPSELTDAISSEGWTLIGSHISQSECEASCSNDPPPPPPTYWYCITPPNQSTSSCSQKTIAEAASLISLGYVVSGPYDTEMLCTDSCGVTIPDARWYCMTEPSSLGGDTQCMYLRLDEVSALLSQGWQSSGSYSSSSDCSAHCSSSVSSRWYCVKKNDVQDCKILTADELNALIRTGWSVVNNYDSKDGCLAGCSVPPNQIPYWYCLTPPRGVKDCYNLTLLDLQPLVSSGWLINSGPHTDKNECAQSCVVIVPPPPPSPTISSFISSPTTLPYTGGSATISWVTTNADTITIDNGVGNVTSISTDGAGQTSVSISSTTTFTITASNVTGTVTRSVTVIVLPAPPTIDTFTSSSYSLSYPGGNVTLSWTTSHATTVTINGQSVNTSGSQVRTVATTTTFDIIATGIGGTAHSSITVTVLPPPPMPTISSFTVSPSFSLPFGGGTVTLAWVTNNATSISINQGIGSVLASGSRNVFVPLTKTFTITATNAAGSASANVTVTVLPAPPVISSFTATPSTLPFGGGSTNLAWSTSNTTSVSIDQGVGSVALSGNQNVTVLASKTFNITATGPGGTVTSSVSVTVNSVPPPPPMPVISSFTATPSTLPYGGGTTTLSWDTSNGTTISIDQGIGSVAASGSRSSISVTTTTTFTITATNTSGSTTGNVTVTVLPVPPVITRFAICPSVLPHVGGVANLIWTTQNATSVSIDHGIGSVAVNGNRNVTVGSSSTYNITATGPGGTVNASVTIIVDAAPPSPVIRSFSASRGTVGPSGGDVTLFWTITN